MKRAKILFFVDGPAPSAEDFAQAAEMAANVVFRNARAVPSEPHALEICDGVAGKVPAIYADKFPAAEKAIKTKVAELKAISAKAGDVPAPGSNAEKVLKQAEKEEADKLAAAAEATKQKEAAEAAEKQKQAAAGQAKGGSPGWTDNKA